MENDWSMHYKLFDHILDAVLVISKDGIILYGNKTAEEFYGLCQSDYGIKNILNFRLSSDVEHAKEQLRMACEGDLEFETIHIDRYGRHVPVSVRSMRNKNCSKTSVISIIRDLTKVTQLSDKLQIFNVSLDIAEEAIIVFDDKFDVLIWNKAAENLFGYTSAEMLGQRADFLIPQHEFENMSVAVGIMKMGQSIHRMETSRLHKNGVVISFLASYSPVYNQRNEIMGYVGVYSDMSEIKKLYDRIEAYKNKTDFVLEKGKFSIWEINLDENEIVLYNNLNKNIGDGKDKIKYNFEQWLTFVHPDDSVHLKERVMNQLEEKKEFLIEYRTSLRNGSYTWVETKGKIIESGEKPNRKILGMTEDITDRKKYEDALLQKNAELETLVKVAENALAAKTEFLANMSHEIRTPLNGITSAVQLLRQDHHYGLEQDRLINILYTSSIELETMISDMFDTIKIESNKIEIRNDSFSLSIVMQEMFNELQIDANSKGIEVGYFFDPRISEPIVSDEQKVRRIVMNLVSNAIKFTENGYISLKTRIINENKLSYKIEIIVKDSGIGIHNNDIESIFRIFTQVDSTVDKKYSGTGLGLTISKRYAEALGGKILCQSEFGKGSSFSFLCTFTKGSIKK